MDQLSQLKEKLSKERPASWENLPDIELYKDQVVGYMQRQHTLEPEDAQLTGAMINNYIKSGLLPRASGKKYTKDHLAYLTAICALKQVLSVSETDLLMKAQPEGKDAERFYNEYTMLLDESLKETVDLINESMNREDLARMAFKLAVTSYVQKLLCKKLLDILKI
ncbi:DUF1836 domain-containing protein [Sinanaerobacter chloroacetimidivorans]|uniref:DUF1836 domain-containing protein n=1 Tax=Sinanaerobacter chloroacetimidivorans TaxID=2818044 RepID=A0A8J8B136_9FIRM|nr:DUF1836 domain-containing protein [Sinanaerobacter chloroacetimidivorans]MBR0597834.1 DUF1836 domain-containing protein [Sinanaerobacter chloroacetimidivorans]